MPVLVVEKGNEKGRMVVFFQNHPIIVGRESGLPLTISDTMASRRHFRIFLQGECFFIEDLQSKNGTLLNGEKFNGAFPLKPGDQICAGETMLTWLQDTGQQKKDELVGQVLKGYQIIERVGRGGMGTVYKALQLSLNRFVALKILSPKLTGDQKFVNQFIDEARASAALNHPNIIQVYDVGNTETYYYFSMEYAGKGSVQDRLRKEDKIPVNEAVDIIIEAASGLEYAEKKQIVHCDIKPDNLMVTDEGRVKIGDLGLAKNIKQLNSSEDAVVYGTPHFISPEQVLRQRVDNRADIYSLGASFYRIISGRTPFTGESGREIATKHVREYPPSLQTLINIPDKLNKIIIKMMEKNPDDRYLTASNLIEDLESFKKDPIPKKSTKTPFHVKTHSNTSAVYVALAGMGALLAIIVGILGLQFLSRDGSKVVSTTNSSNDAEYKANQDLQEAEVFYRKAGDTTESLGLYQNIVKNFPETKAGKIARVQVDKIQKELNEDKVREAKQAFRKAQTFEDSTQGHYEEKIQKYQKIIEQFTNTQYSNASKERIKAIIVQKQQFETEIKLLKERFKQLCLEEKSLLEKGRFFEAEKLFLNFLEVVNKKDIPDLRSDVEDKIKMIRQETNNYVQQYIKKADTYLKMKEFDQAIQYLESVREGIDPHYQKIIDGRLEEIKKDRDEYLTLLNTQCLEADKSTFEEMEEKISKPLQDFSFEDVAQEIKRYSARVKTSEYKEKIEKFGYDFKRITNLINTLADRISKGTLSTPNLRLPPAMQIRFRGKEEGKLVPSPDSKKSVKVEIKIDLGATVGETFWFRDQDRFWLYELIANRWQMSNREKLDLAIFCFHYGLYHYVYNILDSLKEKKDENLEDEIKYLNQSLDEVEQKTEEEYRLCQKEAFALNVKYNQIHSLEVPEVQELKERAQNLKEKIQALRKKYEFTKFMKREEDEGK